MTELRTIITLRQGTTAQWAESQVILKVGEVGLEYCGDGLVKIKAGDGEHLWSGLSYVNKDVHDALIAEVERASAAEAALGNRITTLEGIDHEAYIAADTALKTTLEAAIALKADQTALEGAVSTLEAAIALKADQTALEAAVEALEGADATLTAAVNNKAEQSALETAVSELEAAIDLKAAAADVYTKSEIGAITEDMTLVEMIEAAKSEATYDDTAVKGLIADNAAAIDAIEADYLKAADKTELSNAIAAEAQTARAAEKANADEIARVDAALKLAVENNTEGMDSIKELALWIEKHGTDAAKMTAAIEANATAITNETARADAAEKANAAAITAIYGVDSEGAKSGVLVSEITRVEGLITDAITTAANDASAKDAVVLASAQKYTDDAIAGLPAATAEALGLVKYDDATIKMNDSQQLYVAKVSTDVLEMGTQVLVLNGGSAAE